MARIDWVRTYLENWARWKDREQGGGLGYATQSAFLRGPSSGYREAIIPIDECDAAVTNQAVESLRPDRRQLYDCVYMIYVEDTGIKGAALRSGRAESTIKAQLEQIDRAIAAWFAARAEVRARQSGIQLR